MTCLVTWFLLKSTKSVSRNRSQESIILSSTLYTPFWWQFATVSLHTKIVVFWHHVLCFSLPHPKKSSGSASQKKTWKLLPLTSRWQNLQSQLCLPLCWRWSWSISYLWLASASQMSTNKTPWFCFNKNLTVSGDCIKKWHLWYLNTPLNWSRLLTCSGFPNLKCFWVVFHRCSILVTSFPPTTYHLFSRFIRLRRNWQIHLSLVSNVGKVQWLGKKQRLVEKPAVFGSPCWVVFHCFFWWLKWKNRAVWNVSFPKIRWCRGSQTTKQRRVIFCLHKLSAGAQWSRQLSRKERLPWQPEAPVKIHSRWTAHITD